MNQEQLNKYQGAGTETVVSGNQYPFIRILQDQSAAVRKSHPDYLKKKIEGAESGSIVHAELGLLKQPLRIVPVKMSEYYEEKADEKTDSPTVGLRPLSVTLDKGYTSSFPKETLLVSGKDQAGKDVTVTHALVRTIILGVILPDYNNAPGIIKFQSVSLSVGKDIGKAIKQFRYSGLPNINPPIFARTFLIKTRTEVRKGNPFFMYDAVPDAVLDPEKDGELMDLAFNAVQNYELPGPGSKNLALPGMATSEQTPEAAKKVYQDDDELV